METAPDGGTMAASALAAGAAAGRGLDGKEVLRRILVALALCALLGAGLRAQFVGPPSPEQKALPAAGGRPTPGEVRLSPVVITDLLDAPVGPGATELSPVVKSRQRFSSGRDWVLADILRPRAPGRYPAVILLHGADPRRGESSYYEMAEDLAKSGFVCLFVRYYDRGHQGRGTRPEWTRTVGDALTYATTLPDVDDSKMALLGYSLGAFLSLTYAPTDARVKAVVAFYGGVQPCDMPNALKHMPPTLLLHGTYDRTVSVRHSIEAFQQLRLKALPVDLIVYPEVGHGFTLHNRGGWDEKVAQDSWARVIAFLTFHLKYPAWTPEVPLPETRASGEGVTVSPPKRDLFGDLPTLKMPYLEKLDAEGRGKVLVDPTPEELNALVANVPSQSRRASHKSHVKGKTSGTKGGKAKGTNENHPKASSGAAKGVPAGSSAAPPAPPKP